MSRYEYGTLAISKAGHDKNMVYVIIKEEAEYVYLVDGKMRSLDRPKRKNKKHISPVKRGNILTGKDCSTVNDELIRKIIKSYLNS